MNEQNRVVREEYLPGYEIGFRVEQTLAEETTPFQKLGLYRTSAHGVVLFLDDKVMLTERDEHVYHEMLAHPPTLAHGGVRDALVVGGGDLGTARELLKHPDIRKVVVCEIDGRVVELSRQYFPWGEAVAADPRVEIVVGDGFAYLEQGAPARFDLILVDSSEAAENGLMPEAAMLFTERFFQLCQRALKPNGLVAGQCESAFLHLDFIRAARARLAAVFAAARFYTATISTYPAGLWTFHLCGERVPAADLMALARFCDRNTLNYYTPAMHHACFALPAALLRALRTDS